MVSLTGNAGAGWTSGFSVEQTKSQNPPFQIAQHYSVGASDVFILSLDGSEKDEGGNRNRGNRPLRGSERVFRTRRIGANPEKPGLVNFRGPD